MEQSYEVQPGVHVLSTLVPVPAIGLLPINAFLVKTRQPYLVDTGSLAEGEAFLRAVEELVDPPDLEWIFLTHSDPDHIGALLPLLERAPRATVVTTFLAMAKLQLGQRALPPGRILLLNPGERLALSDRTLTVMRPPVFDAPETTMVHDDRLDALFSADTFGGPLAAPVRLANDLPEAQLQEAQVLWAGVDAPWIHQVDRSRFAGQLRELQDLDPSWVFSSHLPPARRMAMAMCENLMHAPDAAPFVAMDQPAFEELMEGPQPG